MEKLHAILQSEPECVKTVDRNCRLLDMNPAGLEMVEVDTLDEVMGADVLDLVLPEYRDNVREGIARVFAGETVRQQFQIQGIKGTIRWMEQIAAPLFASDGSGTVTEALAVTRDVTHRVELEAHLRDALTAAEESNKAKGRFLANTSHEIRTPLNGIIGGVQLLKSMNLGDEPDEYIQMIESSAHHLLSVLNDILDLSKLEAASLALNPQYADLGETAHAAIAAFEPLAAQKDLTIESEFDLSAPIVETDHGRVRQALNNFLSNAVKFTNQGKVTVSLTQTDDGKGAFETLLEVSDSGIGIPEDMIETVFEPFVQVDQSESRVCGGTGLGLAICRELAMLLGGACGATSKPGEGTTFWLRLPTPAAKDALDRGVA